MRWFVEVGPLGGAAESRSVVEAASWQSALAMVRTSRGDIAPLAQFNVEASSEGGRASNSGSGQLYTVTKAPDDTPLGPSNGPRQASAPPPPNPAAVAFAAMARRPAKPKSADDAIAPPSAPASEKRISSRPPPPKSPSSPPPRPSASTASSISGVSNVARTPVAAEHGTVFHRRGEEPGGRSPLTVREIAVALSGASRERALVAARAHLEAVIHELEAANVPPGRLVHLAIFDVPWTDRPNRPPIVSVAWKDWKSEPEFRYPDASGTVPRVDVPIAAAPIAPIPVAPIAAAPVLPIAPVVAPPVEASPIVPIVIAPVVAAHVVAKEPTQPPPRKPTSTQSFEAAVGSPPPSPPRPHAQTQPFEMVPAPSWDAAPFPSSPSATPPVPSVPAPSSPAPSHPRMPAQTQSFEATPPPPATSSSQSQPRVRPIDAGEVAQEISHAAEIARAPVAVAAEPFVNPLEAIRPTAISSDPFAAIPSGPVSSAPVSSAPASSRPDDLTSEIFESLHDLHFLRDSLEGADFVLELLRAKIPTQLALVHLYDINTKEFVVVKARPAEAAVVGARTREGSGLIGEAVRTGKAILIRDAANDPRWMRERYAAAGYSPRSILVVPVRHGQRYVGAIELADHIDGEGFGDSEINAVVYVGEQFGEFVEQHGITIDRGRNADTSGGYFSLGGLDVRRR